MITIEEMNKAAEVAKKADGAKKAGGFCIAMGIVTLVVGTAVGVGSIVTGAVLRSK